MLETKCASQERLIDTLKQQVSYKEEQNNA